MIHTFRGLHPTYGESCFIAWNAEVTGEVTLKDRVSIWHSASIRGDLAPIEISEGSNVQDNAVLHVDTGVPLSIGAQVTVGHGAILHGCTVGDGSLVGMGAIVLNKAHIGEECIVGAGALITSGKIFPPRSLIVGSPAKVIREITAQEAAASLENARHYQDLIEEYRAAESG